MTLHIDIAPAEGQIPVSFTSEPDWEALAFPKDYSEGKICSQNA